MGIRDDEIKRLIRYAEGLHLKVKFSRRLDARDAAAWTLDGEEIWIYTYNQDSKTDTILSLIHEIGHHLWFIHEKERQPDLKFEEAIGRSDLQELKGLPTPKKLRAKILSVEKAGTQYWEVIYKETNMKFPIWKLHAQMEFDIWMYEEFYKRGKFPSYRTRRKQLTKVREKYRPKTQ